VFVRVKSEELVKMSNGEWMKSSIVDLINAYKSEENLYDPKNQLYYNKKARSNSLKRITDKIAKRRQATSTEDITKKIQTLRTQFGQEVSKIEKSKCLGSDLVYRPKIWWFEQLSWIGELACEVSCWSASNCISHFR